MTVDIHWVNIDEQTEDCFYIQTSVGILSIYEVAGVISKTEWVLESTGLQADTDQQCMQVQNYLNFSLNVLTVRLKKQGTVFRNRVLSEICNIPSGQVMSYSQIAQNIGSGARAVANACRNNPFPGIIPCHRVVSVNGLGGYMGQTSGTAIDIKRKLLQLESRDLDAS